jgi:hypothetical protein
MRKATIYPVLFCLLATFGGITLQADITYEMKSSLSGIPFLKMFEMYQTTCVRDGQFCSVTELEIDVPDTTITGKSAIYMNADEKLLEFCQWEDSGCVVLGLAGLDDFLDAGFREKILDTLKQLMELADEYFMLDKLSFDESDEWQTISGFKCRKMLFNLEGRLNPPVKEIPGDLKVMLDGYSWVTTDFPEYAEYKKTMQNIMENFFTPKIQSLVEDALKIVGIEESFLQEYLESWTYLYVQIAFNMTLEVWSPDLDVPSMSFNLRYNSILENLSFEKIPDAVFEKPSGFTRKDVNLLELLRDSD